MAQNTDWLKNFESVDAPVTNAGALVVPGTPEKPEKPTETFETLSPDQLPEGLNPAGVYQKSTTTGRIVRIDGGAAGAVAPKTAATNLLLSAGVDPATGIDPVSDLIKESTSGELEAWFAKQYGSLTGESTAGMENIAKLKTIVSDMTLQLTGGSLGAGVSNADVTFLKERVGNLADPTVPANERLAAWSEVKSRLQRITGVTPPPPSAAAAAPSVAPIQSGEAFQTEADISAQRRLQEAWDSGASVERILEIQQELGRGPFSPKDLQQMRDARTKNLPMQFYSTPTGKPTDTQGLIGAALETPVGEALGGYSVGVANALTVGMLDELAPILGLDPGRVQAAKEYLRTKAPVASTVGEIGGGVLASIPIIRGAGAALAGTRAAGAAPLLGEIGYGTAYGAGEAPEGERGTGALISGGATLIGGGLANRFLPGGPGTFTGIAPEAAATSRFAGAEISPQRLVEAGEEANIPVMTSDVRQPQTFMGRIGQQVSEIVPFGTAGTRRGQQESREQAVETLLADAGITIDRDIATDVVQNLKEQRSADLTKFNDMKTEVIERLSGAGNVVATKSLDAIDNLIARLESENLPRQLGGLISELKSVKNSLSGPGDLNKIESNRATLFDLKSDPNLAKISTKSEKAFKRVYDALNEDMGDFIKANGDARDFNRWKVANTKLAMMVGELRDGALKRVLDKGDFNPQTVTKMLTSANPNEAKLLFTNLSRSGRANARLLLLQTAANRAFDPNTGIVNPNTFAREVGKLKSNFGQFFGGAEAKRVQGLVSVLNATRRAQESQFAPRSGERLVPFATAGSFGWLGTLFGLEPATGLASSVGFGAASRLYESAPIRNLLIKIGDATGSEKAQLISDFTQRVIASAAPVAAERVAGPEAGPPEGAIMVGPPQ